MLTTIGHWFGGGNSFISYYVSISGTSCDYSNFQIYLCRLVVLLVLVVIACVPFAVLALHGRNETALRGC